LLKLKRCV